MRFVKYTTPSNYLLENTDFVFYKSVTDRRTNGPTDGPMDRPGYRDARTHLKMSNNLKMLMTQFSQMISAYDELNLLDVSTCKSKKIMNSGGPPIANELGAPSGFQGPQHSCPTLHAALVVAMATAAVRNIAIPPLPPTF